MTIEQALELLKKIGADFRGSLADHQAIQQALQVVEKECSRIDPPDPTEPKEGKEPNGNKKK